MGHKDGKMQGSVNLLDLKPMRRVGWESTGDGKVILVIPKFTNPLMVKWFVPLLARPNIRIQLDEVGSFAWNYLDGQTSVGDIAERIAEKFGKEFDPNCERLGLFIQKFIRNNVIVLPGETVSRSPS